MNLFVPPNRAEIAWEGYWPAPGAQNQEELNTKPRNQPPPPHLSLTPLLLPNPSLLLLDSPPPTDPPPRADITCILF